MPSFSTLAELTLFLLGRYHNSFAFNSRREGDWESISTEVFVERVRRVALGLHQLGLRKGDTVGIWGNPSPNWVISDLAVLSTGAIDVPLFAHLADKNFIHQVDDANIRWLVVLEAEEWPQAQHYSDHFEKIITCGVDHSEDVENAICLDEVMKLGDELSRDEPTLFIDLCKAVQPDDIASIVYTTGMTGVPRGAELTHRNFTSQVLAAWERFPFISGRDRVLTMLPLGHVFERTNMYTYISKGVSVYFLSHIKELHRSFKDVKPTFSSTVPLIVEKIYSRIESTALRGSAVQKTIGCWALRLAKKKPTTMWDRLQHRLADKLVYSKIRESLGGSLHSFVVGGAALNPCICQSFINFGIPMYQGYGMTETSPVLCANYPGHNKPGTVGPAFPGVELKLTEEGEILARGPNIMKGYHNDAKGTSVVIDSDGWIHTGDLATIDSEGFVTITGRKREVLKLSTGKMVSHLPIELALCEAPFIDRAMVIGDFRPFVACLLFPNFDELAILKGATGQQHLSDEEFIKSEVIEKEMDKLIKSINDHRNAWERVRSYRFVYHPATVEGGELSPILNMERKAVAEKYSELIESIY